MKELKIGFLPSNWESWDGNQFTGKWAGKMRDRCLSVMEKADNVKIIVPSCELTEDGCVSTPEEGKKALELYRAEQIDALVIGNMTFGMEVAVGEVLSGLNKDMPILHFCTKSGPIHNGSRSTDTWCGQFMTTSAIRRRGFKFVHINTCNPEEPEFLQGFEQFVRVNYAIKRFKGAKIAQIGTRPMLFESQFFSEENFQRTFSQMLKTMDLATLFDMLEKTEETDPEVIATVEDIKTGFTCDKCMPESSIVMQARYEVALKRAYDELGADCMAVSCWAMLQKKYGIAACSTFARLNQQGYITACEVDVLGAATMLLTKAITMDQETPVFIDWTDLHPTEDNVWLAWHCGNAAPNLCAEYDTKKLMANERLGVWGDPCDGSVEFRMKEGPVTCLRLLEYEGEYRMFISTGTSVNIEPYVRGTYAWVKVNDIKKMENAMIEAGAIHHGVLVFSETAADDLEMLCKFLNIKVIRCD